MTYRSVRLSALVNKSRRLPHEIARAEARGDIHNATNTRQHLQRVKAELQRRGR